MSVGSTLLALQDTDLALARDKASLADMPEIKHLAAKRKTYLKLKSELTKLYAQRKDLDIELDELNRLQREAEDGIAAARERQIDSSDYHQVQELEIDLSNYAKQLDKVAFNRKDIDAQREKALQREQHAQEVIKKYEQGVIAETKAAREKASQLQQSIDESEEKRTALAATLDHDILVRYEKNLKRFRGLAVERLTGNMPSVCRMALQASSMSDLKHQGEVATCPYCGRMLIHAVEEA